jgi:hypothetical protein
MKMNTITCRHCGEVVKEMTMHGRKLQQVDRTEHDRVMRESDLGEWSWRARYDHLWALRVISRHAEKNGRRFAHP